MLFFFYLWIVKGFLESPGDF
jgi:hypothetical protein